MRTLVVGLAIGVSLVASGKVLAFSKPVRIGPGRQASVVSDGKHLFVATAQRRDGIFYLTNRSGVWRRTHVFDPKSGDGELPSIARSPGGRVSIAYVRKNIDYGMGIGSVGIVLATRRNHRWIMQRISRGNDYDPALAVTRSAAYVAFYRGDPQNGGTVWLATVRGSEVAKRRVSAVDGAFGAPRILLRDGKPTVAYALDTDAGAFGHVTQRCGLWLWRGGTRTRWTHPPDFPDCRDEAGYGNGWRYDRDVEAASAAGGVHLFSELPQDDGPLFPPVADYRKEGGSVVAAKLPAGKGMLAGAASHQSTIDLVLFESWSQNPGNGTYVLRLTKSAAGWTAGPRRRVTRRPRDCLIGFRCDETPAIAFARGRVRVLFSRADKGSYGERHHLFLSHG